jgi:thiol-disulfide isomerase/thioredoxin
MARTPQALYLVIAEWCPHCVPMSTDRAPRLAKKLGVPLVLLDIDVPEQERQGDALVESFGDWTPDYLVPQLFLAWSDGTIEHLLTGVPGSPSTGTRANWDRVFERFGVPGTV